MSHAAISRSIFAVHSGGQTLTFTKARAITAYAGEAEFPA
jgi:hypothetical protein